MSLDSHQVRNRVQNAGLRAARLDGVRASALSRSEELAQAIALAKGRLNLTEEVTSVFEALQTRAHERSLGAFERLLSAVLNDVLPEEGVVRLLAQVKANATWLDVALEKANGALEDVLDANGGAVTNVISTGLRFAALSRTKNRRLMILDEPDCWLKPERVPAFINVVAQVATQTKTQTFFITHHEPELLQGRVNIVRFSQDSKGMVRATAELPLVVQWEDDSTPGIRSIELVNVRRHEHTVIPCFPGATAFIGDNNLGKSTAIASSFKAVAYGESDDSLIRHGAQEARIVLTLENGQRLEWSRALKRSPSVLYRLYQGDEMVCEGRPKTRNQAPEWVTDVLGVARVDDLDIQVGAQKTPVFLLDDSAPKRAQILSVGKESGHLKTLMRKYEESRAQDRETVKHGELELARLRARLGYLAKVPQVLAEVHALSENANTLLQELEQREKLQAVYDRLAARLNEASALERQLSCLQTLPGAPALASTDDLERVLRKLTQLQRAATVVPLPALPAVPELQATAELLRLGQRMAQASKAIAALQNMPAVPSAPVLVDSKELTKVLTQLPAALDAALKSEQDLKALSLRLEQERQALQSLQEELGECPLCGHAFEDEKGHAHV